MSSIDNVVVDTLVYANKFEGEYIPSNYILDEYNKLCFKCPLSDCKEQSNNCLIKIARSKKNGS